MEVKIVKCSEDKVWYKDKIGQEFEVKATDGLLWGYPCYDVINDGRYIIQYDCEIVEEIKPLKVKVYSNDTKPNKHGFVADNSMWIQTKETLGKPFCDIELKSSEHPTFTLKGSYIIENPNSFVWVHPFNRPIVKTFKEIGFTLPMDILEGRVAKEDKIEPIANKTEENNPILPQHYNVGDIYETFKVAEAWGLDKDAHFFNVLKYIARGGKKENNSLEQDLLKAQQYLTRRINQLQNK